MTSETNSGTARMRPGVRALASAVVLCGLAGIAGCGKTIIIGDAPPASSPPAPASSAPPQPPASGAPATPPASPLPGNDTLQLVDGTAEQNGVTGNGGTVVGAAVQPQPPRWVQLVAVRSHTLDAHLVDVNQSTLYRFDKDGANPSQTTCEGQCATTWPPVTIQEGGRVFLHGVHRAALGAIKRPDGTIQLTIGGWPVYRYSGDNGPGQANGQGLDGTWFAVAPDGGKAASAR
ncbi:hypothetical protein AB0K60_30280 [Thermopolyspora sp. NPDC052614]|uniref:hypothetical protein n=1 Tax=Thermopolyspora sp. NPDC052614 TaxID=3155682 RepID=UPI00343ABF63